MGSRSMRKKRQQENKPTGLKHRYAIKMLGNIPNTILPEGWIGVNHACGAVVYLHRDTRVVTWSRPYTISRETSLKKHNIPLMSIPCLHQKSALGSEPSKIEGKRACPIDHVFSVKRKRFDSDTPVEKSPRPDLEVTDVDANCNGIEQSSEVVENISTCTDMEGVCGHIEKNAADSLGDETGVNLTVNISNNDAAATRTDLTSLLGPPLINENNSIETSNKLETDIITNDTHLPCSDAMKISEVSNISSCPFMNSESQKPSSSILTSSNDNECLMTVSPVTDSSAPLSNNAESSPGVPSHNNVESNASNISSCPFINSESQNPSSSMLTSSTDNECLMTISPVTDSSAPLSNNAESSPGVPSHNDVESNADSQNTLTNGVEETKDDGFVEPTNPDEVSPLRLHEYISNIFEFNILTGDQGNHPIFSSYAQDQPELVEDINADRKFVTDGKTPFQILNEYCQKELKALPAVSKIERHSQHDFTVEIVIKTLKFGIATGDTLREAKHNSAASTLNIFDYTILGEDEPSDYLTIFDKIPSDDKSVLPTIDEFAPMGVKYPYDILVHLLDRNFTPEFEESHIEFSTENINERVKKYIMKYKEYQAEGECENWKQVKQIAAQALILVIYPDLKNWGSVIRLMEAHTDLVTTRELENETKLLKPGKCIMHVLRQEMRKMSASHM